MPPRCCESFNKSFKSRLFKFGYTIVNNHENKGQLVARFYNIFLLFHSVLYDLDALINIIVNILSVKINLFLQHFYQFAHSLIQFSGGTDNIDV